MMIPNKNTPIIQVQNVSHFYDGFQALNNITFSVFKGEIFSFLGPNGAGKTTLINILTTLLPLQTGQITIAGYDLVRNQDAVRHNIGIVFQDETLDMDLTAYETLDFHGKIYSIEKEERRKIIQQMLELAELQEKQHTLVRHLSGGMRRRLEIARGLMTRPQILFLDEPTLGLDPQTRFHIWEYIRQVNQGGTTIFLTTHYMDEADLLSNRIFIIDHGKIIISGTANELKDTLGHDMVYLQTSDDTKAIQLLKDFEPVNHLRTISTGLEITLKSDGMTILPEIFNLLQEDGLKVNSVNMKKPSLNDVFIHYTGRELRDQTPKNTLKFRRRRH
ncbi:MAG: ATP-binding cassette domain-containing protein [Candidatus Helarchaeota archaeon]